MRQLNILRPSWRPDRALGEGLRVRWRQYRQVLLDHFAVVAGVLLLSCALLWAAGEHARQKAQLRAAETNRYITAFQGPPIGDARRRLAEVWHAQQPRQSALRQRIADRSGAPLQAELGNYRAFVIDTVAEYGLARDIDTVIRFYQRLAWCIRIGSCDAKLAAGLFGNGARSFRDQHYRYLLDEYQIAEIDRVIEVIAPRGAGQR